MEKNGRYFTIAKNCTDHLMFLMNDILDFAQLEEKKIVLNFSDEVILSEILNESIELHRFKAESKGLKLFTELDPSLNGARFNTDGNRVK